jgi:MscS family membrane protein
MALLPSQKHAARLGTGASLLLLVILSCSAAWAQFGIPGSTPPPAPAVAQPEIPKDTLGRSTPRGTVFGFLLAARKGQNELAVRYLDATVRDHTSAELAHKLFTVLDRRLPANLTEISDKPEGSLSNLLMPDRELVGTISSEKGNVDIYLERVDRENTGPVWLFSSETLNAIPALYAESNTVPVENILPDSLVKNRFEGIPLFEWLAVLVGMPLFYFLTVLLNRVVAPFASSLRRRLYKKSGLPDFQPFPGPVRLLLLAVAINWTISKINLPLLGRQFWSSVASIITIVGCVWLVILFNRRGELYLRRFFRNRNILGTTSILRLARRVVDLLVVFAGLLVALHYIGVNPTAELAGISIGGIALAFAAQRTLENLISGVSLIFDQAVRVGDIIKVGDTQGTVEDIGLRSTRFRTLDRTLITVPNAQIGNMTIEGISSRDKFWFHPILTLCNDATSSQMQTLLDRVRGLLKESQDLEFDSVRVRFLRIGPSSLDVEIFAYVWAQDWNQFLEIQEKLLLRILECVELSEVRFAIPPQTIEARATNFATAERAITQPGQAGK